MTLDEKKINAIKNAEVLMVDGNEMAAAIEAAKIAKANGTKVLYDCGGLYEGVADLLALTDIMIPSEEFAMGHTAENDAVSAAKKLYELFCEELEKIGVSSVGRGVFGADMTIDSVADGPVTVMLDTEDRRKK